ncbi:hypothetical protein PPHE_b0119 [Pseudoalteromonas phenolica O-BC30]|nr:hypothetical protein [Pseudoalteromonas phenolica O-BC30]
MKNQAFAFLRKNTYVTLSLKMVHCVENNNNKRTTFFNIKPYNRYNVI